MISGTVTSGTGRASVLHTPQRLAARMAVAGITLVPGTLNIRVPSVADALLELGTPKMLAEAWCRLGDLWVYPVWVTTAKLETPGVVCRSMKAASTRVLEVMAPIRFRDHGVKDGEHVWMEAR